MMQWDPDPSTSLAQALHAVATRHPDLPLTHRVKSDPEPFQEVWCDHKKCEVRVNDRDYQVGDRLELVEHCHFANAFRPTGREVYCIITHVQKGYGVPDTHVVMSIRFVGRTHELRSESQVHQDLRAKYARLEQEAEERRKARVPVPPPMLQSV